MHAGLLLVASLFAAPPPSLVSVGEQSGFVRTGRYEEVQRLCPAFEAAYRGRARCLTFGTTPEGRPMLAIAASADGMLEPGSIQARNRPVVLVQGGIHAGEIDGKDAGFWLLRDLLDRKAGVAKEKSVLESLTLVFVPVFNIDGHERFGPNNRPNQTGPEEMGYRVTSQNLNLNRDYVKADAPEMRAMLALLQRYDPIVYADLHVTDGAQFQHDVAVMVEPYRAGREAMRKEGAAFNAALQAQLRATGHKPLDFYPSFVKEDEPSSGFRAGVPPPRMSTAYWLAHNRYALLVETHSWKSYAVRVKATRDAMLATLEYVAKRGEQLLGAAKAADEADARGEGAVALAYESAGEPKTIDYLGYAYVIEPSEISGQPWIRYDTSKAQVWKVPLWNEVKPALTVALAPGTGYVIPAGVAGPVQERLVAHGIRFSRLAKALPSWPVQVFRAQSSTFRPRPAEGRIWAEATGQWAAEKRDLPAGSLYVPASQPGRTLVAHLFEPSGPDSLLGWGVFNAWFERKDGMDRYMVEAAARKMLAADSKLKAEFDAKVKSDAAFAKDPEQRLEFFERRHASFDDRSNMYPVYRVDSPPPLEP